MKQVLFSLAILFGFVSPATAQVVAAGTPKVLTLAYPAKSALKNPVRVTFTLEENKLRAHFEVETPKINGKPVFGPGDYPYKYDVVELFISVGGDAANLPYYEFELSPYDQTFEVRVVHPKQRFEEGLKLGIEHSVTRTRKGWTGDLVIPLNTLGWTGQAKDIVGNAYSILGEKPNRSFWSLSLGKQVKPNFHKPEFFKPLL